VVKLIWGYLLLAGWAGAGEFERLQARFGLGLDRDSVHAAAKSHCARFDTLTYDAAQAAPYASQVQVDCFGYQLFGKARKIELLVNEGRLGFYWIMVDKEELSAIRRRLHGTVGDPLCETHQYVIFKGERVALRFDPAEVLVGLPPDVRAITGGCR
jgi:hypothetical protein